MRILVISLLSSYLLTLTAFAQETPPLDSENTTGEQPDFGKIYYPDAVPVQTGYIEVNPFWLLKLGFGVESEFRVGQQATLGLDINLHNDQDTVVAPGYILKDFMAAGRLKFRYYAMPYISGVFLGGKLGFEYHEGQIEQDNTDLGTEKRAFQMYSASLHVGYRYVYPNHLTLSIYAGAGYRYLGDTFQESDFPEPYSQWKNAFEEWEKFVNPFAIDAGMTIGMAL